MLFYSIASTTAALLATASATALPSRRQTPDGCTTQSTGYLALRPADDVTSTATTTYAGIVSGVKHAGIDDRSDSLLVTRDDNGNKLAPQKWEFAACSGDANHALPPGYQRPTSGPTNLYLGILRPQSATQHCLALESTDDAHSGARNSIVDSYCAQVPEKYRVFMLENYLYGSSDDGMKIYFADQDEKAIIGNTRHAEVQFFTDQKPQGATAQQLVLLPL